MPKGIKGFVKGLKQTEEHKKRMVETRMKNNSYVAWNKGKEFPEMIGNMNGFVKGNEPWNKGKEFFQMKGNTNGFKKGQTPWNKGKFGKEAINWQGGISFNPYPQEWTDDLKESIRKRDNYVCFICGIHKDEIKYKLHCHHIDYNKDNLDPENLITLCNSCHVKTNFDRGYWINYFTSTTCD